MKNANQTYAQQPTSETVAPKDLDAEQRQAERRMLLACKTCGSEITGEGIGSRASFLSRMMRRSGLCLRCFGVRRTA